LELVFFDSRVLRIGCCKFAEWGALSYKSTEAEKQREMVVKSFPALILTDDKGKDFSESMDQNTIRFNR
jgi:tartrate dehydratase beta subunit/fumarate hydratase class I family protein